MASRSGVPLAFGPVGRLAVRGWPLAAIRWTIAHRRWRLEDAVAEVSQGACAPTAR
jgi:hypothetical protein